jgi:hypothetical protein
MTWGTSRFVPGPGAATIGRETVALVLSEDAALLATLWSHVSRDTALDEILDGLSSHGLRNLPSMAIARIEGDGVVRIVVRGSARVVVSRAQGPRQVDPGLAKTWVEEVVEGVTRVDLSIDGEFVDDAQQSDVFHVLAGFVPASCISRSLVEDDPHALVAQSDWHPTAAPLPRSLKVEVSTYVPDPVVEVPSPISPPVVPTVHETAEVSSPVEEVVVEEVVVEEVVVEVAPIASAPHMPAVVSIEEVAERPLPDPEFTLMPGDTADLYRTRIEPLAFDDSMRASEPPPAEESDDYDYMFGRTVARSVQSAAVHAAQVDTEHAPSAPPPPAVTIPGPSGGTGAMLVDGIPLLGSPAPHPGTSDGLTISKADLRKLNQQAAATPPPAMAGDHDGHTISKADLLKLRNAMPMPSGPAVQAVLCVVGHPNPPHMTSCRVCAAQVPTAVPTMVARPMLGTMRFNHGLVIELDRPQLIGRNPKVEGSVGSEIPNLVKLDVGSGLSRLHAAIRIEGWQVLLEDLNSSNGTVVTLPGRPPRRLHAGEPVLLEAGTVVDLGGEAGFAFDVSQ